MTVTIPKLVIDRRFFVVVACLFLVFVVGVLSLNAWESEQFKAERAAAQQNALEAAAKRKQADKVAAERTRLKLECDKEVAYYNAMTTKQKTTYPAPTCQKLLQ